MAPESSHETAWMQPAPHPMRTSRRLQECAHRKSPEPGRSLPPGLLGWVEEEVSRNVLRKLEGASRGVLRRPEEAGLQGVVAQQVRALGTALWKQEQ